MQWPLPALWQQTVAIRVLAMVSIQGTRELVVLDHVLINLSRACQKSFHSDGLSTPDVKAAMSGSDTATR